MGDGFGWRLGRRGYGGTVRNWHEREGGEVSGCWKQRMHFNVPQDLRQKYFFKKKKKYKRDNNKTIWLHLNINSFCVVLQFKLTLR